MLAASPSVFFGAPAPHSPHQEGDNTLPDFTLPLVDMAEMDKPVMVVTVTDIRMMSHVRAAGRGHRFIPASPSAPQTPPTLPLGAPQGPYTSPHAPGIATTFPQGVLGDGEPGAAVLPAIRRSTHRFPPGR